VAKEGRSLSLMTGKEGEIKVIGKLLEKGFEVYIPVVDVGADCIIKISTGEYKEIQIKTRKKTDAYFFDVSDVQPNENLFILCYILTEPDDIWIIPSMDLKHLATQVKSGKKTKWRLTFGKRGSEKRKLFEKYRNNFALLKGSASS